MKPVRLVNFKGKVQGGKGSSVITNPQPRQKGHPGSLLPAEPSSWAGKAPSNAKSCPAEALWLQVLARASWDARCSLRLKRALATEEVLLGKPTAVAQQAAEDIQPSCRQQVPAPTPAAPAAAGSFPGTSGRKKQPRW